MDGNAINRILSWSAIDRILSGNAQSGERIKSRLNKKCFIVSFNVLSMFQMVSWNMVCVTVFLVLSLTVSEALEIQLCGSQLADLLQDVCEGRFHWAPRNGRKYTLFFISVLHSRHTTLNLNNIYVLGVFTLVNHWKQ